MYLQWSAIPLQGCAQGCTNMEMVFVCMQSMREAARRSLVPSAHVNTRDKLRTVDIYSYDLDPYIRFRFTTPLFQLHCIQVHTLQDDAENTYTPRQYRERDCQMKSDCSQNMKL